MKRPRSFWTSEISLLFVVLIWGLNFVVVKAVLAVMHPHVMNVFRLAFSAIVLGLIHARRQHQAGKSLFGPLREDPWPIVRVGLLGYLLYQIAFIMGLDLTTAGSAALIMASAPLWTALVAAWRGYESLTRLAWSGLFLSMTGTVVVVLAGRSHVDFGADVLAGNVVMLVAALLWGSYTALMRPLIPRVRPAGLTFYGVLISLPLILLVAVPYFADVQWDRVTPIVWLAIFVSGGLSTGIAVALWGQAVHTLGPSQTAAFGNAVPVVAVLGSVLLLGETVVAGQIVGGLLTIGGLLVMRRARVPRILPA